MAVNVNIAASGVVGVTGLTPHVLTSANNGENLQVDAVYAVTGTTRVTVNLPLPGTNEDFAGKVIILKTFLPTVTPPLDSTSNVLVISPETRGGVTARIDSSTTERVFNVVNQTVSFYYINDTIGWLAGPATL